MTMFSQKLGLVFDELNALQVNKIQKKTLFVQMAHLPCLNNFPEFGLLKQIFWYNFQSMNLIRVFFE